MNPINFEQSNRTYVKPESMTDEQCGSLPVFVGVDTEQFPFILSKWELSDEELDQINETKAVWLNVVSTEMPPVALFVQNPFEGSSELPTS